MANTTWNPSDLSGVTLSGGNLIATVGTNGGVRAIDGYSSGKFYFECIWTINTNAISSGLALASASLSSPSTGYARIGRTNGHISINNADTGISISGGAVGAQGSLIGLAVDLTAQLIWFRQGPSGNWNGSGTANPATAAGGISISSISSGPLYPVMVGQTSDVVTANFGNSAFSGTVPSGFTSGWPSQVLAPTTTVVLTSGTSWTVPLNFGSPNNVYCIGGGGAGWRANNGAAPGGGGGAFATSGNVALTPGATVPISIGTGGIIGGTSGSAGGNGGNTTFNTNQIIAVGGQGAPTAAGGGAGGLASACTPTANAANGGNGGGSLSGAGGGGGGGAGGPNGPGAGSTPPTMGNSGSGGGAGSGGVAGHASGTSNLGGAGGASFDGTLGGAGGSNASGSPGSHGSGGGGAGGSAAGWAGGAGGTGIEWSTGGAGGGGGGAAFNGNGGAGGLYGGGGAGSGDAAGSLAGAGANGVIVVVYTVAAPISPAIAVIMP